MDDPAPDPHCHYCKTPFWLTASGATRDHIVPRALGGTRVPRGLRNVVRACHPCNVAKAHAIFPTHCERCASAHREFLAWVDQLGPFSQREQLRRAYDRAEYVTLSDIVGTARAEQILHGPLPSLVPNWML